MGAACYGVSEAEAYREFGVDTDAMNATLVVAINLTSGCALAMSCEVDGRRGVGVAVGCGDGITETTLAAIRAAAKQIDTKFLEALRACKCGW